MLYNMHLLYVGDMTAERPRPHPSTPTGPAEAEVDVVAVRARVPGVNFEVSISHARSHLPELLDDVRNGGVVYLTRYGKRLAALVPVDAAEYLDRVEDEYWSGRAREAMASAGPSIPWERVVAELESVDNT